MRIKLADKVRVSRRGGVDVIGTIKSMNICVGEGDPAGELGPKIDEYDTELGYQGSVVYETDDGTTAWAYFTQIEEVIE